VDKYDVFIVNPVGGPIRKDDPDLVLLEKSTQRGWINLGLDLAEVRQTLQKIREHRGNGYVVPSQYRVPRVTVDQAESIARKVYEELLKGGLRLDVLSEELDDVLWWSFYAEDIDAVQRGIIPGTVTIAVDKLDGHLRTLQEYSEWLKLSNPKLGSPT